MYRKYRQLIQEVFIGDQAFVGALDKACTAVINHREPKQQAKAPELVSIFYRVQGGIHCPKRTLSEFESQCEYFMIFLSLRFCVKSNL